MQNDANCDMSLYKVLFGVGGVGHVGVGWGGSCGGGVGWVMQGWGGSYRGGVGWVMQGWVGLVQDISCHIFTI